MNIIRRGRTWQFRATLYQDHANKVPVNLTGWSFRAQIRTRTGHKLIANLPVLSSVPTSGQVTIDLTRGQTKALPRGDYLWDIVRTDGTPEDYTLLPVRPIRVVTDPTDPTDPSIQIVPCPGGTIQIEISNVNQLQSTLDELQDQIDAIPPQPPPAPPVTTQFNSRTVTATAAAGPSDFMIRANAAANPITIHLPPASLTPNRLFAVKKVDTSANPVTINPSGTELIDGALLRIIATPYNSFTIQSNGVGWDVL